MPLQEEWGFKELCGGVGKAFWVLGTLDPLEAGIGRYRNLNSFRTIRLKGSVKAELFGYQVESNPILVSMEL